MLRWIVLFVSIPLVELVLLIEIGQRIGTLYTAVFIVVTGILGATLAVAETIVAYLGNLPAEVTKVSIRQLKKDCGLGGSLGGGSRGVGRRP